MSNIMRINETYLKNAIKNTAHAEIDNDLTGDFTDFNRGQYWYEITVQFQYKKGEFDDFKKHSRKIYDRLIDIFDDYNEANVYPQYLVSDYVRADYEKFKTENIGTDDNGLFIYNKGEHFNGMAAFALTVFVGLDFNHTRYKPLINMFRKIFRKMETIREFKFVSIYVTPDYSQRFQFIHDDTFDGYDVSAEFLKFCYNVFDDEPKMKEFWHEPDGHEYPDKIIDYIVNAHKVKYTGSGTREVRQNMIVERIPGKFKMSKFIKNHMNDSHVFDMMIIREHLSEIENFAVAPNNPYYRSINKGNQELHDFMISYLDCDPDFTVYYVRDERDYGVGKLYFTGHNKFWVDLYLTDYDIKVISGQVEHEEGNEDEDDEDSNYWLHADYYSFDFTSYVGTGSIKVHDDYSGAARMCFILVNVCGYSLDDAIKFFETNVEKIVDMDKFNEEYSKLK